MSDNSKGVKQVQLAGTHCQLFAVYADQSHWVSAIKGFKPFVDKSWILNCRLSVLCSCAHAIRSPAVLKIRFASESRRISIKIFVHSILITETNLSVWFRRIHLHKCTSSWFWETSIAQVPLLSTSTRVKQICRIFLRLVHNFKPRLSHGQRSSGCYSQSQKLPLLTVERVWEPLC